MTAIRHSFASGDLRPDLMKSSELHASDRRHPGLPGALTVCLGLVMVSMLSFGRTAAAQGEYASWREARSSQTTRSMSARDYMAKRVSLNLQDVRFDAALQKLADQGGLRLIYGSGTVQTDARVSVRFEDVTLSEALQVMLMDADVRAEVTGSGNLVLIPAPRPLPLPVQEEEEAIVYVVSGQVTSSEDGLPLPGVNVHVEGTTIGTTTDSDGRFAIDVPDGQQVLVFSFVGFAPQRIEVAGAATLEVVLEPSVNVLDETVVIGYGTARKADLTGSVASVRTETIERLPTMLSPDRALQGVAAGVEVVQNNGQPGSAPRVRIRGTNSLSGSNEPLYVVDGVPVVPESNIAFDPATRTGSNLNEQLNELGISSPLANLNLSDIESIDILKDASAAAIYGSRAANGVVIITTRRGRLNQRPTFTADYSLTTQTPKTLDMLDAPGYRTILTEAAQNNPTHSQSQLILDPDVPYFGDANTNWRDVVQPEAPVTHSVAISSSGGSQTLRYLTSFSALNQSGLLRGSGFERYTGRLNLDTDVSRRFRIGTNLSLSYGNQDASDASLLDRIYTYRPDVPVYQSDGSFAAAPNYSFANPLALSNARNNNETYLLLGSAFGQFDLIDNLTFETRLSLNYNNGQQISFYPGYLNRGGFSSAGGPGGGFGLQSTSTSYFHLFENTLTYTADFDAHSVTSVIGASWQGNSNEYAQTAGRDFPDERVLTNLSSAATIVFATGHATRSGLASYFGRVNYSYNGRYLLTLSGRMDESTRFAADNKRGFFPTIAGAWRISEEPFLRNSGLVSDLKLRASAGVTGQQDIGPYQWRALFTSESYGGLPATVQSQLGNDALKWETTTQYDGGIDFALLDYRLRGTVGYYVKNTKDLLYVDTTPGSTGFGSVTANIGDIQNRGLEFELEGDFNLTDELTGSLSGNISFNRSKLVRLNTLDFDEEAGLIRAPGGAFLQEGQPLGLHYGYVVEGIFQSQAEVDARNEAAPGAYYQAAGTGPGDFIFRDLNGDGVINALDQTVIGNAQPDFTGGFSGRLSYRGVDLSALFTYSVGYDLLWLSQRNMINIGFNPLNASADVLDRWTPENPTDQPRVAMGDPNQNARVSDYYIHDGSYVRLANLNLSYTLPASLTERAMAARVQVYATGTNLFTLTRYPGSDPENSVVNFGNNLRMGIDFSRYPLARSYSMGVRMSF